MWCPGPEGWLQLVGVDLSTILGSEYMTSSLARPETVHTSGEAATSPAIQLAIKQSYQLSRNQLLSPSFLPAVHQLCEPAARRLDLAPAIALRSSVFGAGMLVSTRAEDNRVLVTMLSDGAGGGGNDVFQNVFSSILSSSEMLDIGSANEAEEYFFIKEETQYLNDLEELERLSGSYNVTKNSQRGGGEQICVKNIRSAKNSLSAKGPDFSICLLYGVREERVIKQRLRVSHRAAVRAAWAQEVARVKLGFHGAWSASERDELLRAGEVSGWVGEERHSGHKFPALAGQASNIRLVRAGGGHQQHSRYSPTL